MSQSCGTGRYGWHLATGSELRKMRACNLRRSASTKRRDYMSANCGCGKSALLGFRSKLQITIIIQLPNSYIAAASRKCSGYIQLYVQSA